MNRSWGTLIATLAAVLAIGGCGGTPVPAPPPDLRPAIAAPVKPINAIPKRITIPSIGVDASVIGIGLDNNQFELKPLDRDPKTVGWYIYGPPPGSPGAAVFLSHINFDHVPGAFSHLDKVKVGDKIAVQRDGAPGLSFTVTKVLSWPKADFGALHLYDPTPDSELVAITCGGKYDAAHKNYMSNTIIRAVLDKV